MPIILKQQINEGIVAVWHITETKDALLDLLPTEWRTKMDEQRLNLHNVAARVLANSVVEGFQFLEKDANGKPYFSSSDVKLSLTHAGDYAAIRVNPYHECGIDLEVISERILRIKHKFVREDERAFLEQGLKGVYAVWCAKEALYKYYGLKGLDFKKHLKVYPQVLESSGVLIGEIQKDDFHEVLHLAYEINDNYLMIYTI